MTYKLVPGERIARSLPDGFPQQRLDLRQRCLGGLLPLQDRLVALREVAGGDVSHLRLDDHVGPRQLGRGDLRVHHADRLEDRVQRGIGNGAGHAPGDVDGDHHVRPQPPRRVHRHRAHHAAVEADLPLEDDRLEDPRNRDGGPDGLGDGPAVKHHLFPRDGVGRHDLQRKPRVLKPFAGEVLLVVIAFLLPFIGPIPFLGLEIFVGFIQALVFSLLTLVFLHLATLSHGDAERSTPLSGGEEVIAHGSIGR